jgi:hypothetical protein
MQVAKKAPEGTTILAMLADTGERYLSTPLFADIAEVSIIQQDDCIIPPHIICSNYVVAELHAGGSISFADEDRRSAFMCIMFPVHKYVRWYVFMRSHAFSLFTCK